MSYLSARKKSQPMNAANSQIEKKEKFLRTLRELGLYHKYSNSQIQ